MKSTLEPPPALLPEVMSKVLELIARVADIRDDAESHPLAGKLESEFPACRCGQLFFDLT